MPSIYPTQAILKDVFSSAQSLARPAPETAPTRARFSAWSAVDDVNSKAGSLSAEAQAEVSKASHAAQAKAGQIELYSPKYYAACTFGGLVACVCKCWSPDLARAKSYLYARVSRIQQSRLWTWSKPAAKSIQSCTRAISKPGVRLAAPKAFGGSSRAGALPSSATR